MTKIRIEREVCPNCGARINPLRETCPVCYVKVKKYVLVKRDYERLEKQ